MTQEAWQPGYLHSPVQTCQTFGKLGVCKHLPLPLLSRLTLYAALQDNLVCRWQATYQCSVCYRTKTRQQKQGNGGGGGEKPHNSHAKREKTSKKSFSLKGNPALDEAWANLVLSPSAGIRRVVRIPPTSTAQPARTVSVTQRTMKLLQAICPNAVIGELVVNPTLH